MWRIPHDQIHHVSDTETCFITRGTSLDQLHHVREHRHQNHQAGAPRDQIHYVGVPGTRFMTSGTQPDLINNVGEPTRPESTEIARIRAESGIPGSAARILKNGPKT